MQIQHYDGVEKTFLKYQITEKVNGGTVINAGNADSALVNSKTPSDILGTHGAYGSQVVALSGGSSATGTQKAKTTGSIGDSIGHIIRFVSTGVASPASDKFRDAIADRQKAYGAKTGTALRDGAWDATGISGQRSNWNSSASSAVTGGVVSALSDTFKSTTNNGTDSSDDAIYGGDNSAGELVYMHGAKIPKQADYPARK